MQTLEELIRDLAKRGELCHVSLAWVQDDKWTASYTPSHVFGSSHFTSSDPIEALTGALNGVKHKRQGAATKPRFGDEVNVPVSEMTPDRNPNFTAAVSGGEWAMPVVQPRGGINGEG